MMDGDGNVYNHLVAKGDLVFIPEGAFHTYVNVGDADLVYMNHLSPPNHLAK